MGEFNTFAQRKALTLITSQKFHKTIHLTNVVLEGLKHFRLETVL